MEPMSVSPPRARCLSQPALHVAVGKEKPILPTKRLVNLSLFEYQDVLPQLFKSPVPIHDSGAHGAPKGSTLSEEYINIVQLTASAAGETDICGSHQGQDFNNPCMSSITNQKCQFNPAHPLNIAVRSGTSPIESYT